MHNCITFESYGAHLRNLLTPYANLIALVEAFNKNEISETVFLQLTKDENFNSNLEEIIDFSKDNKMEQLNWRE